MRLKARQIAHLKFAVENISAELLAGLLAGFFNPGGARDVGLST
jgi:hypothetical protein